MVPAAFSPALGANLAQGAANPEHISASLAAKSLASGFRTCAWASVVASIWSFSSNTGADPFTAQTFVLHE